ncbi:hypothetical protein [Myxococcus fulvus]|uniref:hypothetical protein n=1 Tax=Myxococcus fulvus TaxID=33 RepID=UPI0020C12661|nr:hypothetical protein [Myxococcus fulvus]MCK8501332.1 hypothetical protein [Myxococcus fulvus]
MNSTHPEEYRQEGLHNTATTIAIEMEALAQCENCDEVVNNHSGMKDRVRDEALKRFRAKNPRMKDFRDEQEVEDAVKGALKNTAEECSCTNEGDD